MAHKWWHFCVVFLIAHYRSHDVRQKGNATHIVAQIGGRSLNDSTVERYPIVETHILHEYNP